MGNLRIVVALLLLALLGCSHAFETEPEIVLEEDRWVSAEELAPELEHAR